VRTTAPVRALLAALLLGLAACTADPAPADPASPFAGCPSAGTPGPGAIAVVVACFTGGEPIALGALGRPAVLNLWASYCEPCRRELPEFQRFADHVGDRVAVIGVVTNDTRTAAASLATDLGVTFPAVYDRSASLQKATSPSVLPVTLFVDASGVVRHTDMSGALTIEELSRLTAQYLGVRLG